MIIYPAIDLRAGRCVRLYQGNYEYETVYSDSPIHTASAFVAKGAAWLHLVDLDAAKNPSTQQAALISDLLKQVPVSIQVGGGIRTERQIEAYLEAGASRIIIGSLAVTAPLLVGNWLAHYGSECIVLAFDVLLKQGSYSVMTQAWQKASDLDFFDLISFFAQRGLKHLLCTDISRDGALSGPNVALYQELRVYFPELQIQASGGIGHITDLYRLKKLDLAGAITGRALYEGTLDLAEALSC